MARSFACRSRRTPLMSLAAIGLTALVLGDLLGLPLGGQAFAQADASADVDTPPEAPPVVAPAAAPSSDGGKGERGASDEAPASNVLSDPGPDAIGATIAAAAKPSTVYEALTRGAYLKALELGTDDPAARSVAALTSARTGVVAPGDDAASVRAKARDDLAIAYERGDPPSAVWSARLASGEDLTSDEIRTLAERLARAAAAGRADAAFLLSDIIRSSGRIEDQPRAITLLRSAADAGLPDAAYALGVLHRFGDGVARDEARAARLIRSAAEAGLPAAQIEYGLMLFNGVGVEADPAEAARFIRRAAIAGNRVAQNRLARLHSRGLGVPADPGLAAFWHLVAREGGAGGEGEDGISDPFLDAFLASVAPDELAAARDAAAAFHPSPTPGDAASLLAVLGWPEPV